MKTIKATLTISLLWLMIHASAQGWVARINLQINHTNYAFESISMATVTFSGKTVSGSSSTSDLSFTISGADPLVGDIQVSINGVAWRPYTPTHAATETIAATYSGTHASPCITHFIEKEGRNHAEQVYIWIDIHPRSQISHFLQDCERLTLTSNTCAASFTWEVSDVLTEGFRVIEGKRESTISITREELVALGFDSPYGRKYFRVTGAVNTTSQLQPVDIYHPGPVVATATTDPRCHGENDGSVSVTMQHSTPEINDFVVTLFDSQTGLPIAQDYLENKNTFSFPSLPGGHFQIRVENNSDINLYGSCRTDRTFQLLDPTPVIVSSSVVSDFNGFQISCTNAADGAIAVTAAGGTSMFPNYRWDPDISAAARINNLVAGIYRVQVEDSNGCLSNISSFRLNAPEPLDVSLLSTGGKNGFDVSCHHESDGSIEADLRGGVQPYRYEWSDGPSTSHREDLKPGAYHVVVTDANHCRAQASITLRAPAPIDFSIAELRGITCTGENTGILEIQSLTNTQGPVMVRWNDDDDRFTVTDKPGGVYTATILDQQGCSASRTRTLAVPTPVAVAAVETIHPTCAGMCNGKIAVRASGGTGDFIYEWSTGIKQHTIEHLCEGDYHVTVRDSNGCTAVLTQSISHEGPRLELGGQVMLCNGQSHTLDPGASWRSYQWRGSDGSSSSERWMTVSDPGIYWLEVRDAAGCILRDTFLVNSTEDLLQANFMIASEAFVMDTIVVIDITWPLPESTQWSFSEDMTLLAQTQDIVYGQFAQVGKYTIALEVATGACRHQLEKSITISDRDDPSESNGRIKEFVTDLSVYPNPNNGRFEVAITFGKATPVVVTLLDQMNSSVAYRRSEQYGEHQYRLHIDARPLSAGIYTVRIDHREGSVYRRIIVK